MTSIYIAGKISGEDEKKVAVKFQEASLEVKPEWTMVFNPVEEVKRFNKALIESGNDPMDDKSDRKRIMKFCIENLMNCDAIYLLKDWWKSYGASLECDIAREIGLKIIFQ